MRSLIEKLAKLIVVIVAFALGASSLAARAEKPEKIPVALGNWKGPSAGTFKSALRRGLAKECRIVAAKSARVVIDGEVLQEGKGFNVRVFVKSAKSGEVVEQREFPFAKTNVSQAQSNRMGHAVAEIVRRAPLE
jgi:hypothetical protein